MSNEAAVAAAIAKLPSMKEEDIIARYLQVRDMRAAATRVYDEADKQFKMLLDAAGLELLRRADAAGLTGFSTEFGTTFVQTKLQASIADDHAFFEFVRKTGDLDFFQRRISNKHVEEFLKESGGEIPPGLNIFREREMVVRKK